MQHAHVHLENKASGSKVIVFVPLFGSNLEKLISLDSSAIISG